MSTILAGHGTVGGDSQRAQSADNSRYCYMFPGLAETEAKRTPAACGEYFVKLERLANLIDLQNSLAETARTYRQSTPILASL
jgi:hypothetical protein